MLLMFESVVDFENLFVRFDCFGIKVVWSENWYSFFFEFLDSLLDTSQSLVVKMELSKDFWVDFLGLVFVDLSSCCQLDSHHFAEW